MMKEEHINISVIMSTRGRPQYLKLALFSIFVLAKNPQKIEVMIKADEDDSDTINICKNDPFFKEYNIRVFIGPRLGYKNLWVSSMQLEKKTKGVIIHPFGDDTIITKLHWDDILLQYSEKEVMIGSRYSFAVTRKLWEKERIVKEWFRRTSYDTAMEGWAKHHDKLVNMNPWYHTIKLTDQTNLEGRGRGWELKDYKLAEQKIIELI